MTKFGSGTWFDRQTESVASCSMSQLDCTHLNFVPDSWPMMCSSIPYEELCFLYFEAIIVSVSVHSYGESGRVASNVARKRLKRSARCSKRKGHQGCFLTGVGWRRTL